MIGDSNTLKILLGINTAQKGLTKALTSLASGSRINSAADDAAGLAVAEALKSDAAVNQVGVRNAADGASQAAIAEGYTDSINRNLERQSELAAQAANGTLNDSQRAALNEEYQQLAQENQRMIETASFNGQQLLSGEAGTSIQVGKGSITGPSNDLSDLVSGQGDILTRENALTALDSISTKQTQLSSARSELGAFTSRLDTAVANLQTSIENVRAAESRIRDADFAQVIADLTRNQILQNSSTAVLAQANQSSRSVLNLLS